MTTPEIPRLYRDADFNGPLSDGHAARLIRGLGPLTGRRVVDVGCGWAEFLLRALATDPTATGLGVDLDEDLLAHGRANARARGLADRVELIAADVGAWRGEPADVVVSSGATHVWGGDPVKHTANALTALRDLLRPGGRLLFGECFWRRPPTEAEAAAVPFIPPAQYRPLSGLVDLALAHGFRLLALSEAATWEWDDFENRQALGREERLARNPDSPHADGVRERADRHRHARVHGMRETLGFAYLTLVRA
ncbi:cyclopropane-fatty-acyl-phospholipid synthase family protein [Nocardiopsis sp. FIRDI 009]|uniref:SAM-dependent methyltransferase n=1 Tax=Nocardiopsis sp. FIRDI 009 TaxID=714197 RepID=UPI000E26A63A|nr:methyltransferase [Nocardiopsis sp. FIRDI 009]